MLVTETLAIPFKVVVDVSVTVTKSAPAVLNVTWNV